MSARQGQSLTSWLMMVPLLVVPLVAVFGVPKFDQLFTANAEGEEPDIELELGQQTPFDDSLPPMPSDRMNLESASSSNAPLANNQSLREDWANPFDNPEAVSRPESSTAVNNAGEFVDPFAANRGGVSTQAIADSGERLGNQGDPFAAQNAGYTRPSNLSRELDAESNSQNPSQPAEISRWREAVSRLNQLGVQKYQLSQTEEPFVFVFACDLSHPDNPRITHRFQAEAGEPLQAVTKVIQQVETWSAQINNR